MSTFDPKKPSTGVEANGNQARELTTAGGVKVIVGPERPRAQRRRREPPAAAPSVVIFPPGQPPEERKAFLEALCRQHTAFVEKTLLARGDVVEESVKDLRQVVLVIYCHHVEKAGRLPDNEEGFLVGIIRNVVSNHKREPRPVAVGVPDSGAAVCEAPDPEEAAALAERREMLRRYLGLLSPEDADLVRRVDLEGVTLEAVAEALGRPLTNVYRQLNRARAELRERALESERATKLGAGERLG